MYNRIELIQGDTYETTLEIEGLEDFSLLEKVTFSSADLDLCKELTFNQADSTYTLLLLPNETDKFKSGIFDYDITIKFTNDNVLTVIYQGEIMVKEKKNRCDIYGNE